MSSSSSSSSYGSSFLGMGGFGGAGPAGTGVYMGGLYTCVSSTNSTAPTPTTTTSGIGSSSGGENSTPTPPSNSTSSSSSSSCRPYFYKHMVTSRKSFNREIKNLLDIAENKTRVLCKVYDSSMSEEMQATTSSSSHISNSTHATTTTTTPMLINLHQENSRPLFVRASSATASKSDRQAGIKPIFPKDYKKIIDINYSNLRKKQSNVLNKVKLWDQLLESGSLNIASWGKNFFEFS